jgi:hypothetical protein
LAVEQTPATTQTAAPAEPDATSQPNDANALNDAGSPSDASLGGVASEPTPSGPPGFGARGRVRRRARYLRKARELAYRDLGGLVFSLHHFGQRNDTLVLAKLATLSRIDAELRALEASLSERQPLTVLREAGITACPRCAAIHSGEDRFCPNCGLPMSRKSDLPIAGAAASVAPAGSPGAAVATDSALAGTPSAPSPVAAPSPPAGPPATSAPPVSAPTPPAAGDEDQPTEIIRPPAAGS